MRAILLAAGFGTRLRPLTNTIPKCLVPIKGKPLLQIWIERLKIAGITRCVVNTHYLSEKVETFIDESEFGKDVTVIHEEILRGTAGTLMHNIDFFENKDGLLIHADNYCLANFNEFLEAHNDRPRGCLMTVMAFRAKEPTKCGVFELNDSNVVVGFHEKVDSPPSDLANGAIYLLSDELQQLLKADFADATDFSTEVMPNLMGKIYCYETKETFIDIGSPETYEEANKLA